MSLFEYVTVMISMILALALGQLLMSAASLAKHRKHLIPFVPYILWFGCLFLTLINHWWSIWDLRAIEWNYAAFLYILIAPTLMFFAVGLLAVKNVGDSEINLETEFEQVRPLQFCSPMSWSCGSMAPCSPDKSRWVRSGSCMRRCWRSMQRESCPVTSACK
jgi:amino acid transporter